jgi:hypothetical protein
VSNPRGRLKETIMTESEIRELQAQNDDVRQMQAWIDSGTVWHLEGAMGREAMRALETGACFLPEQDHRDFWGNRVPDRRRLEPGTKGTLENSARYWAAHAFLDEATW